jgi:DnaJ-class molecular chaperone
MDPEDFNDIFSTFFSGRASRPSGSSTKRGRGSSKSSRGSSPRSHARAPEPDPEPLRIEHSITFLTAARGGRETFKINTGTSPNPVTIEIRIPAGILDGDTLRVRAGADLSQDALVTIRVGNHPIFRRVQHFGLPPRPGSVDLYADLPLSISEAALGAAIPVPTLDQPVLLKVPAGIGSGKLLRLQGRGIKPEKATPGDMYFVTQIVPPSLGHLTDKDRAFLADLQSRQISPRSGNEWPSSLE